MPTKRVVLAEYFTTEDTTLLFIVREDFTEPLIKEIKIPLHDIRQFVTDNFGTTKGGTTRVKELNVDRWQSEFGQFIEPLLPHTEEGDIIWFVPHDVLHYVPLHALQVEGRYLIERNPVCYTPSASVMKFCHAKRKGRREKALVLGDSRNDLLYAYEESLTVAKLFDTQPYVRGQATKTLVKEMLDKERDEFDILHFSCHGYFRSDQALKSSIVLAPEKNGNGDVGNEEQWNLTAEEIFNLSMNADLVTLSACETGVNERKPGDELIGLTRALIYAGTPSVIVSLWSVDELSTSLLMEHFYLQLRRPLEENNGQPVTKAEALQSAQHYVKNLTAQQVVAYCDQRLEELRQTEDAERRFGFYKSRANAQLVAGDVQQALTSYQDMQNQLDALETEWAKKRSTEVGDILWLLEQKARRATPAINYGDHPFEDIYHWAPFVLVGDWK
ncbi:MAG: CHAT domain-containing protein [Chloroflexota bacterium]|nr:CHAT domain-containing protein [Chloroflexota bacterium]